MTAEEFLRLRQRRPLGEPAKVVLEVRSAGELWLDCLARVVRRLNAGLPVVLLADPDTTSVSVYRADAPPRNFERESVLTIPDVLPGFEVPVARFFEE